MYRDHLSWVLHTEDWIRVTPGFCGSWLLTQLSLAAMLPDCKVKVKQSDTRHGGAWEEKRYSSNSFSTLALDGGEWSASRPGRALPPGKGPPVPIGQEAGWAPEDRGQIICPCRGSNPNRPVVQPVVRHYILPELTRLSDCTIFILTTKYLLPPSLFNNYFIYLYYSCRRFSVTQTM
jgi:hypothetical protein